jgi:hypothetical protein
VLRLLDLEPAKTAVLNTLTSPDAQRLVLVDREGRIAIGHAGVVDPLVFEADINALPNR